MPPVVHPPVRKLREQALAPVSPVYTIPSRPSQVKTPQFIPALVHEIRNPLTNINLAVEMLQSLNVDSQLKPYLDIILRGSVRINDIVSDLLASSRSGELQSQKHSVRQLMDEILAESADRISMKGISIRRDYDAPDFKLEFNRSKIKMALTNIIMNGIEAITEGKGELCLETKLVEGKFIMQIGDNGCGISKKNLKNIFRPYYTTKPGGLGIGLSAAYDILRAEKIDIKVESELGTGTRFIFTFNRLLSF